MARKQYRSQLDSTVGANSGTKKIAPGHAPECSRRQAAKIKHRRRSPRQAGPRKGYRMGCSEVALTATREPTVMAELLDCSGQQSRARHSQRECSG